MTIDNAPPGYHAEFGRSALKDVGINTEEPQIGERWNSALLGWEAWLTPRYTLDYQYNES